MSDVDRRLNAITPSPATPADTVPIDPEAARPLEARLDEHLIRVPTEADFDDVLSPEGNSGDLAGSDVSTSTGVNNAALGGT